MIMTTSMDLLLALVKNLGKLIGRLIKNSLKALKKINRAIPFKMMTPNKKITTRVFLKNKKEGYKVKAKINNLNQRKRKS